jgi:hypothetical protein
MLIGKLIKEIAEALLLYLLMIDLSFLKGPNKRKRKRTDGKFNSEDRCREGAVFACVGAHLSRQDLG